MDIALSYIQWYNHKLAKFSMKFLKLFISTIVLKKMFNHSCILGQLKNVYNITINIRY